MTTPKPHSNLDELLLSRACQYGNFNDVSSRTARIYHHMVYGAPQFINKKDMSTYYEALHMIAVKIARLVEGQINGADSWLDIAGYAMLVHNHITAQEEAKAAKSAPPPEAIFKSQKHIFNNTDDAASSPFPDAAVIDAMEAMEHELAQELEG